MSDNLFLSRPKYAFQSVRPGLSGEKGNILVYIVIVMVIFAVLGAAMVSLFSTSTGSSATANESRRAFYLAEAGLRYGLSELRQKGFVTSNITTLNTTEYKMPPSGNFDITVFGAWFKSPTNQSVPSGALSVEIDKGRIPPSFFEKTLTVPAFIANLYLVVASLDPGSSTQKPNSAEVAKVNGFSHTVGNDTSFTLDLNDDLVVGEDKHICMAFKPLDGTFTPGNSSSYLDLNPAAANIFPKADGSFQIGGRTYFYKTAKEEGGAFRIRGITPGSGVSSNPVTVAESTDYILLSPNNYFVTSKGTSTSGQVTFGGELDNAVSLADHSYHREADYQKKPGDSEGPETDPNYVTEGTDAKGEYLQIGGVGGSQSGASWFNQSLTLGGQTNYCSTGECFFKTGIRAFFTLEYSGCGEGLMFALFNGQLNNIATVGGDVALPELLGYGGDSRLDNAGTTFLDTNLVKGIQPPKIGLEFDAKVNIDSNFEKKPVDFCSGGNLIQNTRNDPGASSSNPCPNNGRDNVQYVYWGSDVVNVPCRTTPVDRSSSYDDNRHDPAAVPADDWFRSVSGVINTSPAITSDGKTIYIGSNNSDINPTVGHLYAFELDADGYPKPGWETPFFTGTSVTSPVLSSNGTIYVGSGTRLYAFAPDKSTKPGFPFNTAGTVTKPAIGGDGTIYIVANVAPKFGYVYAIRPDGSLKPGWTFNPQLIVSVVAAPYVTAPVMSADNSRVYVAAREGSIYAFRETNGSVDWQRQPGGIINAPVGVDASAVYTGTNDKKVYALNATNGSIIWTSVLTASEDYSSSPVAAGGTVYIGNYDDHLYAINASNGTSKWQYFAAGNVQSTPFVDSNGTIYFGSDIRDFSDNNNVRALYSDGTEKWKFPTGGDVRGTPAVKSDGTVYIGSFNYNFYAINQFANPKSIRDKSITSVLDGGVVKVGGIPATVTSENNWLNGDATKGPWAVRLEVYRSFDANVTAPVGYYKYELRSWVRQCNQADCSDLIGTFYDDTQVTYSPVLRLPQMTQTINMSSTDNTNFQRFLFGFSSQTAAGDIQTSTIRNFKLSFVRPTSPVIVCDPNWPESTICP